MLTALPSKKDPGLWQLHCHLRHFGEKRFRYFAHSLEILSLSSLITRTTSSEAGHCWALVRQEANFVQKCNFCFGADALLQRASPSSGVLGIGWIQPYFNSRWCKQQALVFGTLTVPDIRTTTKPTHPGSCVPPGRHKPNLTAVCGAAPTLGSSDNFYP